MCVSKSCRTPITAAFCVEITTSDSGSRSGLGIEVAPISTGSTGTFAAKGEIPSSIRTGSPACPILLNQSGPINARSMRLSRIAVRMNSGKLTANGIADTSMNTASAPKRATSQSCTRQACGPSVLRYERKIAAIGDRTRSRRSGHSVAFLSARRQWRRAGRSHAINVRRVERPIRPRISCWYRRCRRSCRASRTARGPQGAD